ncbi:MAG: aspartate/glutamate racemase family protein [Acidimicrobiia bacterium]|nr:aspartate/glutamate racemase family protein [Acidimicrobiia bacterium]
MRIAVVTGIGSYTEADRERRRARMSAAAWPGTEVELFALDSGVPYVESSLELALSGLAVARVALGLEEAGFDAIVGTAFLDNGLDAARELVRIPVVGPAKVTLYLAATLANRFGIVMAAGDLGKHAWAAAKLCGVADRVVGIETLRETVADLLHDEDRSSAAITAAGRRLVDESGAEALVLGCGATTGLAAAIGAELGVPVLDPGLVALKHAESMVALGLSQSARSFPTNARVVELARRLGPGAGAHTIAPG